MKKKPVGWAALWQPTISQPEDIKSRKKESASFEKEAKLFQFIRKALIASLMVIGLLASGPVHAQDALCRTAIQAAEPASHLPPHLLAAIALAESGRTMPGTGAIVAWPWTIDINGVGRMFDSKEAAIAAVQEAQQNGIRSIDVGCMQINLFYHPQAFATLDDAFDPAANVAYAVRFLAVLHQQTGDWPAAIAAYHSATPERGQPYAQHVAALWPDASRFGLSTIAAGLAAQVDPYNVLTPEFRAERIAAAEFRQAQSPKPNRPTPQSTLAALEDEVDPKRILTSEFRAQMVAAAAFRHQRDAQAADRPRHPVRPLLVAGLAPP